MLLDKLMQCWPNAMLCLVWLLLHSMAVAPTSATSGTEAPLRIGTSRRYSEGMVVFQQGCSEHRGKSGKSTNFPPAL